jgi:hypothetical protein
MSSAYRVAARNRWAPSEVSPSCQACSERRTLRRSSAVITGTRFQSTRCCVALREKWSTQYSEVCVVMPATLGTRAAAVAEEM